MTRRESRIAAFELLFEADFQKDAETEKIYENAREIREAKLSDFSRELYFLCCENMEKTDEMLSSVSTKWKINRMNRVTRTVLRLAVTEIMHTDTPAKAAINEAVEIAKLYGDDKAPAFVNGVLNTLAREMGKLSDAPAGE